jgi:hypothetical protein
MPAGSRVEDRVVKRGRGHWCWSCQQTKPNEAFSGGNHGRHLCRTCAAQHRRAAREKRTAAISAGLVVADAHPSATACEDARAHERFSDAEDSAAWIDPQDASDAYATPALAEDPAAWIDPQDVYDVYVLPTLEELLEAVLALPVHDRGFLAEQLVASLPADPQWLAELECRARRALTNPEGGEAWDIVTQRPARRVARR